MNLKRIFLAGATSALALTGCVGGFVYDASSQTALANVKVVADATCSGTGCGNPVQQFTDSAGRWVFDAYGVVHGENETQTLSTKDGQEAIKLTFSKSGYSSRIVFHTPRYETYTYQGEEYEGSLTQNVYLCVPGAADSDGDGVCNAAELKYGTNPNAADTDGDSLGDAAELFGEGGVDLPGLGADPKKKDLFIEVDWYPGLKPSQTAFDRVTQAFASAPVSNFDGTSGIALHFVMSNQIAAADVDLDLNPVWDDYTVIKNKYFPSRRGPYFHYLLVAHRYNGGSSSGRSRGIPGHDFLVTLGNWATPGGTEQQQAGTLMHELGHNLGLEHGGNEAANDKPNYLSVMSYTYQMPGLQIDGVAGVIDYSRLRIASVNESSVNEVTAFTPVAPTTAADLARYRVRIRGTLRTGTADANLDINGNSTIQSTSYAYDFDNDGDTTGSYSASQNDWGAVVFDGADTIGGGVSAALISRPSLFIRTPETTPDCVAQ